ncbi:BURP domain-containing protein 3-like [Dioscorea cayenensis subsp. rotundata]|uniref:BURP domain-containing protein 3-like n=1 Tax=Dioscorea cayennensis subsp. rotundata TaxID=55577 RepID=A0AB40CPR7_DIOCR|nr:BURP domain-containing protein 3-like [Dioscorea cayenensis subsp. rotundata]
MLPNSSILRAILDLDELDKEKFNVDLNDAVNGLGYSLNGYVDSEAPVHVPDVFNGTLFFLEKEVIPGSKLHLRFTKMFSSSPLISRLQANTIPFAANKLLEILTDHIHVKPTSVTASVMNKTLIECEEPALEGESKHCATLLESMVEFHHAEDKLVAACHSRPYPYAVFYCHAAGETKAYTMALEGDGTKVEAVAVCHLDTSKWNPKHLAFQVLKVKPGSVPICHFMPKEDVLWTIRN